MSVVITSQELVGRQVDGTIDNFYDGFTRGPYTVGLHRQGGVKLRHAEGIFTQFTHCVFDGTKRAVIVGTEAECADFVERFNLAYAKHIMLKDTKP
jgi:hypothetical protein